ncbi:MAG: TldD/PmbA family protein [Candidatus Eisenbacteria sp.]|nr:TldD/PmbA family protein [Candidatus Eisenbacteria bacterium]
MRSLGRRGFLKWAGAGAAVITVPTIAGCRPGAFELCAGPKSKAAGGIAHYFEGFGIGSQVFDRVMAKGLSRGGDFCDIYLQHSVNHWTGMEDGQINRAYGSVDLGAGVRVLKGDATGFAYTEELTEQALLSAAETAAAVADGTPTARPQAIAAVKVKNYYPIRLPWAEVGVDRKLPIIEQINSAARNRNPNLVKVSIFLGDEGTHVLLVNSEGRMVEDYRPMATLWLTCVGMKNGRVETCSESLSAREDIHYFSTDRIVGHAHFVADTVEEMFSAVEAPAGEMPVVLAAGTSGILLHEAMGHPMEADFNRKGTSIYADRMGQRIACEHVTIIDDATNPHMRGSINVDDEGEPGQRTVLVENGILRSYLHDRISSKHYRVPPTGSGRRQSFRYPPVPRMRNTYMLAGPHDPAEVIASVKKGIYAETFANGQVNIGAGDFTFYLQKGHLIENGKLTRVIKDANLIGNGPKVLESIDLVGTDLTMFASGGTCGKDGQRVPVGFGLPTVRAGEISVGGRNA